MRAFRCRLVHYRTLIFGSVYFFDVLFTHLRFFLERLSFAKEFVQAHPNMAVTSHAF
jgi:hypothetical protein